MPVINMSAISAGGIATAGIAVPPVATVGPAVPLVDPRAAAAAPVIVPARVGATSSLLPPTRDCDRCVSTTFRRCTRRRRHIAACVREMVAELGTSQQSRDGTKRLPVEFATEQNYQCLFSCAIDTIIAFWRRTCCLYGSVYCLKIMFLLPQPSRRS